PITTGDAHVSSDVARMRVAAGRRGGTWAGHARPRRPRETGQGDLPRLLRPEGAAAVRPRRRPAAFLCLWACHQGLPGRTGHGSRLRDGALGRGNELL